MKRLFFGSILVLYVCLIPAAAWIHGSAGGGSPNTIALSNTSIVEMSANGTFLGSASIVGSFTGSPSWSLTDALGVFQINSTTGVVTVLSNTNLVNATHPTIPITISASGTTPSNTPGNFTVNVTIAGGPGLVAGTYGSTTSSGWTFVGPSDGTLSSGLFTNIIYVSDSMGSDLRDGSVPTFVDDNTTEQFALSSAQSPVAGDTYHSPNMSEFTVAVSVTNQKTVQMTSRTGLPDASGTLTRDTGSGPATMAYTAAAPGIHGPVKTLTKGAGGTGPGLYDPDNNGSSSVFNGDGTGLGTIGNWRTAGGVGSAFGMRDHSPDWLLLRMGDTFTNQSIERGYSFAGGTDGFGFSGFSEQEPIVIGSYDEAVPATSPDLPSGARARPIVVVPSATPAYAAMQSDRHSFDGRDGLHLQGGGNYIAVMGISFLAAQRNPSDGAYVGLGNVADNLGVDHRGGQTGSLIEDSRASWFFAGFAFENLSGSSAVRSNFDVNIRRSQADHCYQQHGGHSIGFVVDSVGAIGGAISPGFTFEENVIDLCGYANPALTTGDSLSRNAYLQWDSVFGYRRGNTSTRSASEDIQFRSGGVIDNNFMYNGSYGFDVGHNEGFPTLASNTVVTNNVVLTTDSPFAVGYGLGINFLNSNGVTASGNIIAHYDPTVGAFGYFAQTDAYNGNVDFTTITNAGTGGTPGDYALGSGIACAGSPTNFTGGSSPSISIFAMNIGAGGTITPDPGTGGLTFIEPSAGQTYNVGDVLTPVAGYPSINTTGTSLTAVGTGGTLGDYGTTFGHCSRDAGRPLSGDTQAGVALTNFSGSMAGSGAVGTFTLNSFTSVTRALVGGTYIATGITTNTNTINDLFSGVGTKKFTVTGAVPSAYNGTWTLAPGTSATQIVWDLGTAVDPGPVTTPGNVTAFAIIATGAAYQAGDVLTAASGDVGGQTGIRLTVGTVAHLSGWVITVDTIDSSGVHGLTWTNNVVFNWPPGGPTAVPGVDAGGTHDSPGGIPGSGTANTWTGNSNCAGAQFTGVITGTNTLTTSALVQGTIAIGQNLAGASVMASTTITGGSGTSWTVSPNQTAPSETMYSYTCTPTVVYSHPEQTMVTYAASLGLTASIDGYMNAALANARWNWDPALTANNGINPYIRLGFQ